MTSSSLAPGSVFHGRYRVVRTIKSGGMGTVYEVLDTTTNSPRALKVMLPAIVQDADQRARFALEAKVTGSIESDHLVRVFDAGVEASGEPFLVMDLLRGEDLQSVLAKRGALPAEEVIVYVSQLARLLEKTHAAGIVHRDLKPENLFLTRRDDDSPCVKVLDFGIAKVVAHEQAKKTRALGTPLFMAPEQIRGDSSIGPPTDLYACSHVAYALLTGEAYWTEDSKAHDSMYPFLMKLLSGATEAPSARALRRNQVRLPPAFDAWFARATAVDPAARFEGATALTSALTAALRGQAASVTGHAPQPAAGIPPMGTGPGTGPAAGIPPMGTGPGTGPSAGVPPMGAGPGTGPAAGIPPMGAGPTRPSEYAPVVTGPVLSNTPYSPVSVQGATGGYGPQGQVAQPGYGGAPQATGPGYGGSQQATGPGYGGSQQATGPGYGGSQQATGPGNGGAPQATGPGYGGAPQGPTGGPTYAPQGSGYGVSAVQGQGPTNAHGGPPQPPGQGPSWGPAPGHMPAGPAAGHMPAGPTWGTGQPPPPGYSPAPPQKASSPLRWALPVGLGAIVLVGGVLGFALTRSSGGTAAPQGACGEAARCVVTSVPDASHVEPLDLLPQARELAQGVDKRAALFGIFITDAVKDGTVDLNSGYGTLMFHFGTPEGALTVLYRQKYTSVMRGPGFGDTLPDPRCPLKSAWKAAIAAGAPTGKPMSIQYQADPPFGGFVWMINSQNKLFYIDGASCALKRAQK